MRGWAAVSLLLFSLSHFAVAADSETLRIAVAEFPPGFVSLPDGKAGGAAVPIVEAIFREAGYGTDLHIYPIGRVHALIEDGSVDVSVATRFFDTDGSMIFTDTPFGSIQISLFFREGVPGVASLAELDGKAVIIPIGQSTPLAMLQQAAPNAQILQPRTHENALHMLRSSRANYLLDWRDPIITLLTERKERLRHLDLPPEHSYFVIPRHRKDAEDLVRRLDLAMKKLIGQDGLPAH
jgi:ABC-type amino acid transport substrate-binding protein